MNLFDLVLLLIIAGFALAGLRLGLVHTLGSLLGTVAGVYVSGRFYEPVSYWLIKLLGWDSNYVRVLVFAVVFFAINRLVGLAFWFVEKTLKILTKLPIISSLNKMLGLVFGLVEGVIVIGMVFYFISKYPLSPNFMAMINHSFFAPYMIKVASILLPLVPSAVKMLKDYLVWKV